MKALTLIEAMIAVLVFTIIVAATYYGVTTSLIVIKENMASNITMQLRARGVIDIMSQDLRLAEDVVVDASGDSVSFNINGESVSYEFSAEDNSIVRTDDSASVILTEYVDKIDEGTAVFTLDGNGLTIRYDIVGVPVWLGKTLNTGYICGRVTLRNEPDE